MTLEEPGTESCKFNWTFPSQKKLQDCCAAINRVEWMIKRNQMTLEMHFGLLDGMHCLTKAERGQHAMPHINKTKTVEKNDKMDLHLVIITAHSFPSITELCMTKKKPIHNLLRLIHKNMHAGYNRLKFLSQNSQNKQLKAGKWVCSVVKEPERRVHCVIYGKTRRFGGGCIRLDWEWSRWGVSNLDSFAEFSLKHGLGGW